jgi:Mg-chelatase subunit ChlD
VIQSFAAVGNTPIGAALRAARELVAADGGVHRDVVLVSDCEDTCEDGATLLEAARSLGQVLGRVVPRGDEA